MLATVEIPVWLFLLILLFAAVSFGTHFLFPPVRWFFRRRMEHAVEELNKRLERPIQPFKLYRRTDMIQRLIYDPVVAEAVTRHARTKGVREDVAFAEAKRYAREIVPSFSASAYFGFAIRAARWLSTRLYDVRLEDVDAGALAEVDRDATVVFVMNHRSNMDYVLVTYLAADRSALSYAVGEWARVWPLSRLFRAMGAYFIRRRERNALYRRVLARYVQLATAGGVTQAIFPEGGLSLDGHTAPPKLGLLGYIAGDYDRGGREVVFVPVALSYDKVIEDRILVEAGRSGARRFRGSFLTGAGFVLRWLWRRMIGRARRFGMAAVHFGPPLALSDVAPGPEAERVEALAQMLIARIDRAMPVLPVPLVAAVLEDGPLTRQEIAAAAAERAATLGAAGRPVHLRGDSVAATVEDALSRMLLRRLVEEREGCIAVVEGAEPLRAYYAASAKVLPPPRADSPARIVAPASTRT
ncbi:glycerol-3-phosphate acyltransferase [Rhodobacteraceae bacterium CCMM004]|nr:glycerol-3-phosphate acyltransferase [Rhodobacteraceae bacterium CCMM004]